MKSKNRESLPASPELREVRLRIESQHLDSREAARQIGVTPDTLDRHLAGEYVRSDSLAKYRRWLNQGTASKPTQLRLLEAAQRPSSPQDIEADILAGIRLTHSFQRPQRPHLVVDLFSGCGGMSLGFEVYGSGGVFETVLAVDIDEPMVRCFNANHLGDELKMPVARQIDLADFLNETEVLAFYLEHLAALRGDAELCRALEALPVLGIPDLVGEIGAIDAAFLNDLGKIRESREYISAHKRLPATVLGQTSVIGFHDVLGLPITSRTLPQLRPLVWSDRIGAVPGAGVSGTLLNSPEVQEVRQECLVALTAHWEREVDRLRVRAAGAGRGQLASSALRIQTFLKFVESRPMTQIRAQWLKWRADRQAIRAVAFGHRTHNVLKNLYSQDPCRISVLLGGPPCQGFSRIGRGKLRSLRDQQVHVQADPETGDRRNSLLHTYVLFVSALAPKVFLFENVRHFQAEVKTPEGTYLATDVLAEAIREISSTGLKYQVASRILDASKHLVPETRERFFMVGVRSDVVPNGGLVRNGAAWCLALQKYGVLPVRDVLDGLPEPVPVNEARANGQGLRQTVAVAANKRVGDEPDARLSRWLTAEAPGAKRGAERGLVDAHHVRAPRSDDAALFSLFGPGMRWMDYRCDNSETLRSLRELLLELERAVKAARKTRNPRCSVSEALAVLEQARITAVLEALNGSLSLRLLLESIPAMPGELRHHLLTPGYLSKREGHHGDWLARLHPDRPSKTIMSHMAKDTYAYIHPFRSRTLSVREAARIQTFPDWYSFGSLGLVEAFRAIGNAVPPLLSFQLAERVAQILDTGDQRSLEETESGMLSQSSRS